MDTTPSIIYNDLAEGMTREHDYVITPVVYESFLRAFDDRSPLHVDSVYARQSGFDGPVMHGGILNGFVSHFVGMVWPGRNSLLLSVELRYSRPTYLGDHLRLHARLAQKLDAQQVVVLHLNIFNQTRNELAATGRAQVKVRAS